MSLSIVLGMPTIAFGSPRRAHFLEDRRGPALGAVAADAEEDVDLLSLEGVDDDRRLLVPARAAQDGAAQVVDVLEEGRD